MARNILFAVMIAILAFVQPAASLTWQTPGTNAAAAPSAQGQTPSGVLSEVGDTPGGGGTSGLLVSQPQGHALHLKSRDFTPDSPDVQALAEAAQNPAVSGGRLHFLVQLDFIPRQAAKDELERQGLKLLDYVPDYGWIASSAASSTTAALDLPGVVWAGPLAVDDKLDPAIRSKSWASYNYKDGIVAVYVALYEDEALDSGRSLVEKYGGKVISEVSGANLLVVEMPEANLRLLAGEEAVQWIEPAEPPLGEANDGIRNQIGVNTVQAAPYGLDGSGVRVLVFDSGQVYDHVDFGARLIHGDTAKVEDHSTHVAGTLAGSGANSAAHFGSANQWKGMAPNANIISYGYTQTVGSYLFYSDPGDIQHDWAEAQNTYGAVIGTASLNTNAYMNYLTDPNRCANLMGRYGATSVLLDQIVRGGNAAVGLGDKYISTWAAGNERGSATSCSNTYSSTSPPAGAKNPIQVGASNTNDNSMTTFSSWGPTIDGRLKPIVTAGGCQTGGDDGITSTLPKDLLGESGYNVKCGTSMATPAVAGVIGLMLQEYRNTVGNASALLWPSTIKALLMNTATDFGSAGPDFAWGYGQVDAVAAVDLVEQLGFIQSNLSQGGERTYFLPVTSAANPLKVSLAWDDWEATFNANPALINNLDLELESPSGVIWRPWILNPASPAALATRGIDNRNNQEMVEVPAPEVGTWTVRVKGATVPHGPQDFSLACKDCHAIDLGVCQNTISSASAALEGDAAGVSAETGAAVFGLGAQLPTAGDRWQNALENGTAPEEMVVSEEQARREETRPDLEQGAAEPLAPQPRVSINGGPCTYGTIQQAINAAASGNTIRISGGTYFETIDITGKNLTLEGGYDGTCTFAGTATTRLNGSLGSGSVVDVMTSVVTLSKLQFTWGSGLGAGVDVTSNAQVTLDASSVFANHGTYGGGIYVSPNSSVTIDHGSTIHDNTASLAGGGVQVWGQFNGYQTSSDIYYNCAPDGGGFSVAGGTLMLDNADVIGNQAAGAAGKGGGIYVTDGGTITLANSAFVGDIGSNSNTAFDGGGIYADASTVNLQGVATAVANNTASHNGGGIFLANASTLHSTGAVIGYDSSASMGNDAVDGAGIYSTASTIDFSGRVINNIAANYGAGIYASGGTVTLTGTTVGGAGTNQPNKLGADGNLGAGLYLTNGVQASLDNTVVSSNIFTTTNYTYGGGIYATGSTLTLENSSRVEFHNAPHASDGRGAGIYASNSTVTVNNSRVNNNSAGAVGGGIRLLGTSTLNVQNGASIDHNAAVNSYGGGIAADATPDINIENATLQYNTSAADGGAVFIRAGTLDFTGWWDVRWNNAGGSGGAIAVEGTADADLFATSGAGDTLLAVNHAGGNGGAVYASNTDTVGIHATNGYPINLNTNTAAGNGGALYSSSGAFFDLYGQIVASSNGADANGGLAYLDGGSRIWIDDYFNVKAQVWVNHAGGNGGAIYAANGATVSLDGAVIGGNVNGNYSGGSGGALYLLNSTSRANNCLFQNNKAPLNGGAIYISGGTLDVKVDYLQPAALPAAEERLSLAPAATGCSNGADQCSDFHFNLADSDANGSGNGGAIYILNAVVNVDATYFHNNSASRGGGIFQGGTTPSTQVRNSLFYTNTSTANYGGGIRNEGGDLTVSHVTLADSTNGAGFSSQDDVGVVSKAVNSIAWGNAAGGFWGSFMPESTCNIDQSAIIGTNIDPQFQPGGLYRLKSTSPGIDACLSGLATDLRNAPRPVGSGYDMGPYEAGNRFIYVPVIVK